MPGLVVARGGGGNMFQNSQSWLKTQKLHFPGGFAPDSSQNKAWHPQVFRKLKIEYSVVMNFLANSLKPVEKILTKVNAWKWLSAFHLAISEKLKHNNCKTQANCFGKLKLFSKKNLHEIRKTDFFGKSNLSSILWNGKIQLSKIHFQTQLCLMYFQQKLSFLNKT